jgi:hypothetical protein
LLHVVANIRDHSSKFGGGLLVAANQERSGPVITAAVVATGMLCVLTVLHTGRGRRSRQHGLSFNQLR